MSAQKGTINRDEILHFAKDSSAWWDEGGPFKPLHRLNPVRLGYIKDQICGHYDLDKLSLKPLLDLKILDIGCGGGLVCEPMARMGAKVTGIDADTNGINIARTHAEKSDLSIQYICGAADNLEEKFDVVLALEVIEHTNNPAQFIKICTERLKPNGLLILSTLNRTPKSFALGIVAAEYVLRWVPRGTHHWSKFQKPSEIVRHARNNKLDASDVTGLIFNPLKNDFALSKTDLDVNYLITLKSRI